MNNLKGDKKSSFYDDFNYKNIINDYIKNRF